MPIDCRSIDRRGVSKKNQSAVALRVRPEGRSCQEVRVTVIYKLFEPKIGGESAVTNNSPKFR